MCDDFYAIAMYTALVPWGLEYPGGLTVRFPWGHASPPDGVAAISPLFAGNKKCALPCADQHSPCFARSNCIAAGVAPVSKRGQILATTIKFERAKSDDTQLGLNG